MKSLKDLWTRQAQRIDALSIRERAFMFVSLAAALVAATDALVLSPQFAAQRQISQGIVQQTRELDELRSTLAAAPDQAQTPQGRLQAAIARARSEQAELDGEVRRLATDGRAQAGLQDLLARVLRRHERLTLLKLDSAAPKADPAAPGEPLPGRGVDLQLRGRHADLVAYLREIETQMPGLRWTELQVDARAQPPTLSVRVMLPGGAS